MQLVMKSMKAQHEWESMCAGGGGRYSSAWIRFCEAGLTWQRLE